MFPEIKHRYGEGVRILDDPFLSTELARLCHPDTCQPLIDGILERLYSSLIRIVVSCEFPKSLLRVPTRMIAQTDRGVLTVPNAVDRTTQVVVVDIARAGIVPSLVCFRELTNILDPRGVRQDHLVGSRQTDSQGKVIGTAFTGEKIGGPVDNRYILFPDPMGATGSSFSAAKKFYESTVGGRPKAWIVMHLIVTPEYIAKVKKDHPDVVIYAFRLDRGLSPEDVLQTIPGTFWDRERGLDDHDYIVPGAGGMGEVINNSYC